MRSLAALAHFRTRWDWQPLVERMQASEDAFEVVALLGALGRSGRADVVPAVYERAKRAAAERDAEVLMAALPALLRLPVARHRDEVRSLADAIEVDAAADPERFAHETPSNRRADRPDPSGTRAEILTQLAVLLRARLTPDDPELQNRLITLSGPAPDLPERFPRIHPSVRLLYIDALPLAGEPGARRLRETALARSTEAVLRGRALHRLPWSERSELAVRLALEAGERPEVRLVAFEVMLADLHPRLVEVGGRLLAECAETGSGGGSAAARHLHLRAVRALSERKALETDDLLPLLHHARSPRHAFDRLPDEVRDGVRRLVALAAEEAQKTAVAAGIEALVDLVVTNGMNPRIDRDTRSKAASFVEGQLGSVRAHRSDPAYLELVVGAVSEYLLGYGESASSSRQAEFAPRGAAGGGDPAGARAHPLAPGGRGPHPVPRQPQEPQPRHRLPRARHDGHHGRRTAPGPVPARRGPLRALLRPREPPPRHGPRVADRLDVRRERGALRGGGGGLRLDPGERAMRGLVLLALAAALLPGSGGQDEHRVGDISMPSIAACGGCHQQVYEEWAASLHARAWTNANVRTATEDFGKKSCRPCHSPRSVFETGFDRAPAYRDVNQDDGVHCLSCHGLADGGVAAARTLADAPCKPRREPRLLSAQHCYPCHEPTHAAFTEYATSDAAALGLRCVDCHMQPRADGSGRSHGPHGGMNADFVRRAVAWSAEIEDGVLRVRVRNRTGHKFPGEIPSRSFLLEVELGGHEPRRVLLRKPYRGEDREDDRLRPDEERTFSFPLPPDVEAGEARVKLLFLPLPLLPEEEAFLLGEWPGD